MEEKQKVWIRGDKQRGDEVIKALEDLGADNGYTYNGKGENLLYFINHYGIIDFTLHQNEFSKVIRDNYKEIKLPERWKNGDVLVNKEYENVFSIFKKKDNEINVLSEVYLFTDFDSGRIDGFHYINNIEFRLATSQEVEKFYELLHKHGKEWDDEKKRLVKWKWKPENGERFYTIDEYCRADAHDNSPWISVNDKMPKISQPVLLHIKGGNEYVVGALSLYSIGMKKTWRTITLGHIGFENVDYWMAIPQLPEGDEK